MSALSIREFSDRAVDPHVVGFLHTPETPNGDALILTHGAGGNAQAPLLRALAEAFANAGYTVLRCNLPYRQARSFGPPGPADAVRDRAGLKNAIAAVKGIVAEKDDDKRDEKRTGGAPFLADVARSGNAGPMHENEPGCRIFLGGHSYGGRQASMLCAEEPGLVAALLLLSYPLHPPRRPEQQRTQHLPDLRTPTLFVSGTRDPFGSIEELQKVLKMIPAKTRLLPVEGAGHDLGFKGKGKKEELPKQIVSEFTAFFADS
ncbi:MAG: alpha/beta family hydrolase [Candidatus Sulfotelmatobacter sp.]